MTTQRVLCAQSYTIREDMKDAKSIRESFKKLAEIGYHGIQLAKTEGVTPQDLCDMAGETGLKIVSGNAGWDRFQNDLDAVIAEHKLFKCKNCHIGGLPADYRSPDGLKRFVKELAPVAERLNAEGMTFSYHNHSHELAKYDGKTWLETLYELASPAQLKAELDVYWIQHGGGDPVQWICRYAGRQPLMHLKDMAITPQREQRFAEIGQGNLNWKAILQAAQEAGVEYYIVEQDQCYDRDPFDSLALSYKFLKSMGLS